MKGEKRIWIDSLKGWSEADHRLRVICFLFRDFRVQSGPKGMERMIELKL